MADDAAVFFPELPLDGAVALHRRRFGIEHENRLVDQMIEEMAELTKELLKRRRMAGREPEIASELADVLICAEFLCRHLGITRDTLTQELQHIADELVFKLGFELSHNS